MSTTIDIKKEITKYLNCEFPQFPVMVSESPEDSMALWIQVFCVTPDQEELVEEAIFDAQEKFSPTGEIMFLPMVKSLAITKQYYPEYLPKTPVASPMAVPIDLFKISSTIPSGWSLLSTSASYACEGYDVLRQESFFRMESSLDEVLKSAAQSETIVTEKDENFEFAA